MRYLLFINSLIILFLGSCNTKAPVQKLQSPTITSTRRIDVLWNNGNTDSSLQFLTKATIYGKEIKGILFIKKITDSLYKTSFLAQGSLKLFDMDLLPDTFIVHQRAKQIDKPIVLNTLANDLKILSFEMHKTLRPNSIVSEETQMTFRINAKKKNYYYVFDKKEKSPKICISKLRWCKKKLPFNSANIIWESLKRSCSSIIISD